MLKETMIKDFLRDHADAFANEIDLLELIYKLAATSNDKGIYSDEIKTVY